MDIFSFFTIAGGLAFFLYGMHVMSVGLEKLSGGMLEQTLRSVTSSPWRSLLVGAGITIAIQSSSAMTVMLVGLVNSGIMQLSETVGLIFGSNIGTTLTAWILSLAGIQSDNPMVRMLNPESFSPIIAFVGIAMMTFSKKKRRRDTGEVFVGFAILMYGMELMSGAVSPLADSPNFSSFITRFNNPILGVLTGTLFTAIIQSSAASVGILQALSLTGGITFGMALPVIMGLNIGTCATALISSIGATKDGKRVAVLHTYIKTIATILGLIVMTICRSGFNMPLFDKAITPVGIAVCHTIFNIAATIVLYPFSKKIVHLAELTVRGKKDAVERSIALDDLLLNTPSVAVAECKRVCNDMAKLVQDELQLSIKCLDNYNESTADLLEKYGDEVDEYEDKIGSFLIRIHGLSEVDRARVNQMLRAIGDLERIGDHCENIMEKALELHRKKISFSTQARAELEVLQNALAEIVDMTVGCFCDNDDKLAGRVEPLEQVIDSLKFDILARHFERLQAGTCTIELGFILSDLLTDYERISDHCSNLAVGVIQTNTSGLADAHEYLHEVKSGAIGDFKREFAQYEKKYSLASLEDDR